MLSKRIQVFLVGLSLCYKSLCAQVTQTQSDQETFLENLNDYDSFVQRQRTQKNVDDILKLEDRFFWHFFIPKLKISFQYQDLNQIQLQSQINLTTHQQMSWSFLFEWDLALIFEDLWFFQIDSFNQNTNELALYDLDFNHLDLKNKDLHDLNSEIEFISLKEEGFSHSNLETLVAQRSALLFRQFSDLSSIDLLCLLIELHKIEDLIQILNPMISSLDHKGYQK